MTTVNYGLTTWDNKHAKPQQNQDDDRVKLPFLRLNEGNNVLRIITPPANFWHIKFKDGKSKFGTRVNCAYPDVPKEQCPTVQAGYRPKQRYLVGVIDRAEEGGAVKLFDMSVVVYEQLQSFKDDDSYGTPDQFDINVRFNPKSGSPQGFYSVIPRAPKPLSEEDQELIKAVGMDVIEENLIRLCKPPSVERVRSFLERLGWDGSSAEAATASSTDNSSDLAESSDEDYSFDKAAN